MLAVLSKPRLPGDAGTSSSLLVGSSSPWTHPLLNLAS